MSACRELYATAIQKTDADLPHTPSPRKCVKPAQLRLALCLSALHEGEELGRRIPIADGHLLVDRRLDYLGQIALTQSLDQAGKVENALTGVGFIHSFSGANDLDSLARGQRLFQKHDIITVVLRIFSKSSGRILHYLLKFTL